MQLFLPEISTITSMSAAVLSFHVSERMECAQLSIKEESEDETKYGSSGLHPDTKKISRSIEFLDPIFQINMECVLLSIKEEIADETKYGSSSLHSDIGVLEEDSSQVNARQII